MMQIISRLAADIIMQAVGEYLDCERFDSLRIAGEIIPERREEYTMWLNIHGQLLHLWTIAKF